jgi:hypothetical protein
MSDKTSSFFHLRRSGNKRGSQQLVYTQKEALADKSENVKSTPVRREDCTREDSFRKILSQGLIDLDAIRGMSWAGIPVEFRATVWRLFLEYEPVNAAVRESALLHKRSDYFDCVERVFSEGQRYLWTNAQRQTQNQIRRDLPRTRSPLLRTARVQLLFERILFVWSVRHPASGYVQGMNDLVQPFFFAFLMPFCSGQSISDVFDMQDIDWISESDLQEIEADCFWSFSKLLDGMQDLYTKDQPGLYKMLESLARVIERVDPELHKAIISEGIQYQEFAFRWMNCMLVREFGMELIFRLWDSYLSHYSRISVTHVYVCAALLVSLSGKLVGLSRVDFVMTVQSIDKWEWQIEDIGMILAQGYVYEKLFAQAPSHLRCSSLPRFQTG